jgi:Beta/Gamma crystallin
MQLRPHRRRHPAAFARSPRPSTRAVTTWGCAALALVISGAACAQAITFFQYQGFGGRRIDSDRAIADFEPTGMNDTANAVIVRTGRWQVCTDAWYQGRCATLGPGEYPNLGAVDMAGSISSARPADGDVANAVIPAPDATALAQYPGQYGASPSPQAQYQPPQYEPPQYQPPPPQYQPPPQPQYQPPPQPQYQTPPQPQYQTPPQPQYQPPPPPQYQPPPPPQYQPPPPPQYQPPPPPSGVAPRGDAAVVLFDEPNFGGASFPVVARVDNLDITHWNDRAVSMVIHYGNWELCTDAYYRGTCSVYGPGRYSDIGGGMMRQLSSLRPAGDRAVAPPQAYVPPSPAHVPPPGYANARTGPRAVLYDTRDFGGGSVMVEYDAPNFDPMGFNDRAQSIRVESGTWVFCSDAGYRGDCMTFAPGDYPNLPGGLERRISSGHALR